MPSSFAHLVALALALLVGTALAAALPLYLRLSPKAVNAVSTFSTGLLVGAALTIVIPEGVSAVFESSEHGGAGPGRDDDGHGEHGGNAGWIGAALLAGFVLMYMIDSLHGHDSYSSHPSSSPSSHTHNHHRPHRPSYRPTPSHLAELEPLSRNRSRDSNEYAPGSRPHTRESSPSRPSSPAEWDEEAGSGLNPPARPGMGLRSRTSFANSIGEDADTLITADASSVSTVIGLLAHSLADGISLGASSLASSSTSSSSVSSVSFVTTAVEGDSLQLIIFLAIILHKAPTAFALSSLLSSSPSTSPAFVRRALALFSLAAPAGALATYLLLTVLGKKGGGLEWWTGLTLVFSGGTFLFVATHAVREQEKKVTKAAGEEGGEEESVGQKARLALVLAGMVTPGLLSKVVGHGH
ncbi:hypothetical protein JCM8547_000508 [Rhodosporidiobolus lusitaniae]